MRSLPNNTAAATILGRVLRIVLMMAGGCAWHDEPEFDAGSGYVDYPTTALSINYPDVYSTADADLPATPRPATVARPQTDQFREMSLQEAVQLAMTHSQVLRDLGGLVLQAPDSVATVHNPAIQETDPRFGVDAALSAFDASWTTSAFFEKNDRALNNQFFGGGTRFLTQDLLAYSSEIFKQNATGGQWTARHNVDYDFNNAPGNNTPNLPWATNFELEMRQPLLKGAGVDFNRIAGPNGSPGVYNGVLIARINTDITLAEFQAGVRNLAADVETAYWELYYAWRSLDAKVAARDRALATWRHVDARFVRGLTGGEAHKEAQTREQFYRLEADVQNALSGQLQEASRSSTFRGTGGIYQNERRLRLLIGLPAADGHLIRPTSEPTMAKVTFPWDEILSEALHRRSELRRQKWVIRRRELELLASKNFLRPQFDALGRYRWRGLGHHLIEPNGANRPEFNDAFQNMFDGNYQEWALGFELTFPGGYRQAHAAVRNAELQLARDLAVLEEQERMVVHQVSSAVCEKDRAWQVAHLNFNRMSAAADQVDALQAVLDDANPNEEARLLDLLLDAQRRLADSEANYHRSLVEYMLAIKHVHFAKGSLLDYNQVFLSEGPWPCEAWDDAEQRDRQRVKNLSLRHFRRGTNAR